jgi:transposase
LSSLSTGVPVGARKDLIDRRWRILEPLLPTGKRGVGDRSGPRRQLINGIRWRLRVGAWTQASATAATGGLPGSVITCLA